MTGQGETGGQEPSPPGRSRKAHQGYGAEGGRSRYREEGVRELQPGVQAPSQAPRCRCSLLCRRALPEILAPLLPTAQERRQLCWARCVWVAARCTHAHHHQTRTAKPPAPRQGPPRPEQVAPGLGAGTIPASSSQGSRAPSGAGENPPPRAPGCSGYPRSPPARSTRPELPLPVRLPAAAAGGSDGGDRAASIPQGWGGGSGSERGAATLRAPGHGASQKPSFSSAGVKGFPQAPLVLSVDVSAG